MKRLLLVTAALFALAGSANAAVVGNLGINPTSQTGDFRSGLLGVNGTGAGGFTDQVVFQLVGGPQFFTIASATNVYPAVTDFIANFTAQGFLQVGAIGGGDDIPVTPVLVAQACPLQSNCQGFAGSALLNAGNYYLQLAGIGGGTSGYGGNLAVTQVPLPGALALFASGLVGLGLLRRRRKTA
jgi:MYXO-CTERM domain-containing protein